jgi:aspartate/methionine/tyrosine aminotransferase
MSIPDEVREAFVRAIRDGHSYYCDAPGLPVLRERLSSLLAETAGTALPIERLFVTPGSCQAIAAVLLSLAFDGGVALLPEIHWPMHLQQVRLAGLLPKFYRTTDPNLSLVEALEEAYEPGVCVLLVNSPSNPTGQVLDESAARAVYEWAQRRCVWLISDEAYEDFIFEGPSPTLTALDGTNPPAARIVFSIHTFSKSFSMTGYRLGYVAAPNDERSELLQRVQEATLVAPSTPVQFAGLAALDQSSHVERHHDYVRGTRDEVVRLLAPRGLLWTVPRGGWYALLDLSRHCQDADSFCRRTLAESGLALAPGQGFAPGNHPAATRLARLAFCRERSTTLRGLRLLVERLGM